LPEFIEDKVARVIYIAAMQAETSRWNVIPTVENLADIIAAERIEGYESGNDIAAIAAKRQELISLLQTYAENGTTSLGMNGVAAAIRDHVNVKRLAEYAKKAVATSTDQSLTATDRYDVLSTQLEAVRPAAVEARIYTLNDQLRVIRTIKERQVALIGKKLMTLPSEWMVSDLIPYLLPGLLYTFSGLTGRGKSSILQQIADHLARSGFKVLYFHAEDDIERQMNRMTRRLADASPRELQAGDPNNRYPIVMQMMNERKRNSGGEVIFVHSIDQSVGYIKAITQNMKPDAIIVDYVQKLNRQPELRLTNGIDHMAIAIVTEGLKLIAENDKHMVAVILGSKEAEHTGGDAYRTGTSGSRQIEHKSQAVVEFERIRLTPDDAPEIVDGIQIAGPGDLSGFGYMNVVKNNDGSTGSVTGIFHGHRFEFKSLGFKAWEREHPGQLYPLPTLELPDQEYYDRFRAKSAAWDNLDLVLRDPRTRRAEAKKAAKSGTPIVSTNRLSRDDEPPF